MNLWNKDTVDRFYPFVSISGVIAGFQEDELILNVNAEKPIKMSLQYANQRGFVMELLRTACGAGTELSKSDSVNNPRNINFSRSSFENRAGGYTSPLMEYGLLIDAGRVLQSDMVLPPRMVRQDVVYKKCETLGESMRYLSLGIKQIIISRDKELSKIVNLIPLEYGKILVDYDMDVKSILRGA